MIKLFITDLDGCLSWPFESPDWDLLTQIRTLNTLSRQKEEVPALSICSGRPLPYVEAVCQWLDIDQPVVFESAGLYEIAQNKISIAPKFDKRAREHIGDLKAWLEKEVIVNYPGMELEFTKLMDAGIIHTRSAIINEIYPQICTFVAAEYPEFEVHKTEVSVNIILKENNKAKGIQYICTQTGVDLSEVAYIGDSGGDVPALKLAGYPFAPQNAAKAAQQVAEVIPFKTTKAVLAAYKKCIEYNRNLKKGP